MKLTAKQVEKKLGQVWGTRAVVVPYRICGNRYVYAARDYRDHWLALDASWVGGCRVFEPSDGSWPEPKQTTWSDAVLAVSQRARAYFLDQGNSAALRRLPRAEVIADRKNWQRVGDESDTWLIRSSSKVGIVYEVNGRCTCTDYAFNRPRGGWCKHRIARALAKRAAEILENENGAGSDCSTPAPNAMEAPMKTEADSTTNPVEGQVQRIDLSNSQYGDFGRKISSDLQESQGERPQGARILMQP